MRMILRFKLSPLAAVLLGAGGLLAVLIIAGKAALSEPHSYVVIKASRAGIRPGLSLISWPAWATTRDASEAVAVCSSTSFHRLPPGSLAAKVSRLPDPVPTSTLTGNRPATVVSASGVLDQRRQFALGMIESGNHDGEIGGAGEVSRYQIMPSVWRCYSDSRRYHDPEVSLEVAQQHWTALYNAFRQHAHREPTDFDMYVLWNTHYSYYSRKDFNPSRVAPVVRDRAQRYVNLVQWGLDV